MKTTNITKLTSKEACTLAHKIRKETGCSLAEAFKKAYNTAAPAPTYYTMEDLSRIFSDKVKELLGKGYMIHTPTMSGSQGEIAYVTFIKNNTLYRLNMFTDNSFDSNIFTEHLIIQFGKSTENDRVLQGYTFWAEKVEVLWFCIFGKVARWRRSKPQREDKARYIPAERMEECEAKATERVNNKYSYDTTNIVLTAKTHKAALKWVKTLKGYKSTRLADIQGVIHNTKSGGYIIIVNKDGKITKLNTKTDKR